MPWDDQYQYNQSYNNYGSAPIRPGALPQQQPQQQPVQQAAYVDPLKYYKGLAQNCLVYGILNCVLYFLIAYIVFVLVADPTSYGTYLDFGSMSRGMTPFFMVYFVAMAVYAIIMVAMGQELRSDQKVGIFLMSVLPGILCIVFIGIFLLNMPFARGVMLTVPLIGVGEGAHWKAKGCFYGQNLPVHTTLDRLNYIQIIGTLALGITMDAFLTSNKAPGAIAMYAGFVAFGLIMMCKCLWVYTTTIVHLGPERTEGKAAPKSRFKDDPMWSAVVIFIVVTAVCAVAFKPPLELYFQDPELEIESAHFHTNGSVSVAVINKAGTVAYGKMQIWVNNTTKTVLLAETDKIEGFGRWDVTAKVALVLDKTKGIDINLTVDGKEVSKIHARRYYSGDCMIPVTWIILGVSGLGPVITKRRYQRDRI